MKKIFKIIFVNILLLLISGFILEVCSYFLCLNYFHFPPKFWGCTNENIHQTWMDLRDNNNNITHFGKKPILFLGCSYTYGQGIEKDEDTFPSVVEKITNRKCYNYGVISFGPESALFLFDQKRYLSPLLKDKPEYIIYTFMFDHLQRNDQWRCFNSYRRHNLYPKQKYNFAYKFWTVQYIQNMKMQKYFNSFDNKDRVDFFFSCLKTIKKECDSLFPDSKFIVLLYYDINKDLNPRLYGENNEHKKSIDELFEIMYSKEFKERFKDMGISVVSTEDLIGRKMDKPKDRIPNDTNQPHPSVSAWEEIAPALIKYYNL